MASNNLALAQGAQSSYQLFEAADQELYRLQHFCAFVQDVAAAAPAGKQASDVKVESIQVVFGVLGDRLAEARAQIGKARQRAGGSES